MSLYVEGYQRAGAAVWSRRSHRPEADTEAGLGRARLLRVCS